MPLVVQEGAVCLVTLRDGRCDIDDATFDSFSLFYILGDVEASWDKSMQPRVLYV